MGFVIYWHESAMDLHVFPITIPPPTSLSTRFLWVFPVHQARALVSCIQPGLVICFTIDNIHAVLSKHPTLAFSHRVQKSVLYMMSLLFNMLSRFVISFLPRSKRLLISWLQSPSAVILEPKKIVWHCFPIYFPWSEGTRCHDLSFLNVELQANFFTLLFHFHQEAF